LAKSHFDIIVQPEKTFLLLLQAATATKMARQHAETRHVRESTNLDESSHVSCQKPRGTQMPRNTSAIDTSGADAPRSNYNES